MHSGRFNVVSCQCCMFPIQMAVWKYSETTLFESDSNVYSNRTVAKYFPFKKIYDSQMRWKWQLYLPASSSFTCIWANLQTNFSTFFSHSMLSHILTRLKSALKFADNEFQKAKCGCIKCNITEVFAIRLWPTY